MLESGEVWAALWWPSPCPSLPCLLSVVPAIEKLLSSDWKERFLGRSSVETKDVKGAGPVCGEQGRASRSESFPSALSCTLGI